MSNHYRRSNGYDNDVGYPARSEPLRRIPPNVDINMTPPAPYYPPNNPPSAVRYRPPSEQETNRYRVSDIETTNNKEVGVAKQKISHPVPILRLILDLILLILGWVPLILLNTIAKPFERGFYCDDESIRYPLKQDTVTSLALYTVGAAVVVITVIILETVIAFTVQNGRQVSYAVRGKSIHPLLSSLYIYLGYCVVGFLMIQIATDICKNMVGRLRPHFIDACDPDWSKINCTGYRYVEQAFCQNANAKVVKEARVSWLSGHSSYSSYMMFYLVIYLQARWRWPGCSLLAKHFLQFAFVMLALFTGLSRISDYKHHWSDVLSGYALGTLVACLTTLHVGKFFKREMRSYLEYQTGSNGLAEGYPMFGARYDASNDHGKHVY